MDLSREIQLLRDRIPAMERSNVQEALGVVLYALFRVWVNQEGAMELSHEITLLNEYADRITDPDVEEALGVIADALWKISNELEAR